MNRKGNYNGNKSGGSAWRRVGEILVSKQGKAYVKIKEDVTLQKDMVLQMQDPRDRIHKAVEAGRMTEEQAEERLSKIKDFVKYELVLAPPRD
jgi:hypothetical protein